jgi:hypothetical protein
VLILVIDFLLKVVDGYSKGVVKFVLLYGHLRLGMLMGVLVLFSPRLETNFA